MADEINADEIHKDAKAESDERPVLDLQDDDGAPDVEAHHIVPAGGNCISVLSVAGG